MWRSQLNFPAMSNGLTSLVSSSYGHRKSESPNDRLRSLNSDGRNQDGEIDPGSPKGGELLAATVDWAEEADRVQKAIAQAS